VEPVVNAAPGAAEKDVKEWRAKMAAEKRAKIMAQMQAMQKSFLAGNAHLLGDMECESAEKEVTETNAEPASVFTCILCQQDTQVKADGPALVLCAMVQKSTIHVRDRNQVENADVVSIQYSGHLLRRLHSH